MRRTAAYLRHMRACVPVIIFLFLWRNVQTKDCWTRVCVRGARVVLICRAFPSVVFIPAPRRTSVSSIDVLLSFFFFF
uniref:Putative secreted protein n=1 Tax=Ixodes ricinus TaxID=34613 RepID=A0A6B0U0D2_IXORI